MDVSSWEVHDAGASWVVDDVLFRASHALVDGGRVWIVDPVDAGDALERVRALGEPAAVLQLLSRHNRDSAAVARRLGVPHHKVPDLLPETPFSLLKLDFGPGWRERALWWPQRGTLVVPESIGSAPVFAVGRGPAGVHPMRRLAPPGGLRPFVPEHLLVGHGAPLHGSDAAGGLIDALERSRSDLPRLALKLPRIMRGMLGRH
jgi:hypothetical protein